MTESTTVKKRIDEIDIIKGIGIILMVLGHSGSYAKNYVYLFHMAIFFIASGFVFKSIDSSSYKNLFTFGLKRIKQLYIPYVFWTVAFSLLHNFFIKINIYTTNPAISNYATGLYAAPTPFSPRSIKETLINCIKGFFLEGGTQLGGTFWFLKILLFVGLGYGIVEFFGKKYLPKVNVLILHSALSLILLAAGYFFSLKGITLHGIAQTCSVYILYHIGRLMKEYRILSISHHWLLRIAFLVIAFALLFVLNTFGTVSLAGNSYENPAFFLTASLLGWLLLYEAAYFIKQLQPLKDFFVLLGQNTLSVAILHFLCFKPVSLIGIMILGDPSYALAAFPVLYMGGLWWIPYTLVGLFIPILLSLLYKNIKKEVFK